MNIRLDWEAILGNLQATVSRPTESIIAQGPCLEPYLRRNPKLAFKLRRRFWGDAIDLGKDSCAQDMLQPLVYSNICTQSHASVGNRDFLLKKKNLLHLHPDGVKLLWYGDTFGEDGQDFTLDSSP